MEAGFPERLEWVIVEKFGGSASALARAVGRGPSTITDWRKGRHAPSKRNLSKLARVTGLREEWLLSGEEPREEPLTRTPDPMDSAPTLRSTQRGPSARAGPPDSHRFVTWLLLHVQSGLREIYEKADIPLSDEQLVTIVDHIVQLVNDTVDEADREGWNMTAGPMLWILLVDTMLTSHRDAVLWATQRLAMNDRRA